MIKKLLLLCLCGSSLLMTAQSASSYVFSASDGTYVSVEGTDIPIIGDDASYLINLPGFDFPYAGSSFSTFSVSTNGLIRLGQQIEGGAFDNTVFVSGDQAPAIAVFWDDHNRGNGSISYLLSGTAPHRMLEIGWNNIMPSNGGQQNPDISASFKVRLNETTGVIEMWYGTLVPGTAFSATVGINDGLTFLNVDPAGPSVSVTQPIMIDQTEGLTGKHFVFFPPSPCQGLPEAGVTLVSDATVCMGEMVTFSLSGATNALGISYQWQFSSDGETFADIDGETNPSFLTFPFTSGTYRCEVFCGGESAFSEPVAIVINPVSECYCSPVYGNGMTDGDLISHVVIPNTTLDNESGTEPVNPYYTYFTGQPNLTATLQQGHSYDIEVTVGTYTNQNVTAWIDYNQDGFFSEDERLGGLQEIESLETAVLSFTLQCDAAPGTYRLRIRDVWNTDPFGIDPCAEYGYGETEDYDLTITESTGCSIPSGLSVPEFTSTTALIGWNPGCSQSGWEVVVLPEGTAFDPSGFLPASTYPLLIGNLEPETTYEVYIRAVCEEGLSDWSEATTFTTSPQGVANDDCFQATALEVGESFDQYLQIATNEGATRTIGEAAVSCGQFNFGGDVWFSVTVPDSGSITIQTRPEADSELSDTVMAVYSGSCGGALSTLGCNDDSGLEGMEGFSSLSFENLNPGEVLLVRVWEYANDVTGTFQIAAFDTQMSVTDQQLAALVLSPNPAQDFVQIHTSLPVEQLSIHDTLGRHIREPEAAASGRVDVSDLNPGVYLLGITIDGRQVFRKFVKK